MDYQENVIEWIKGEDVAYATLTQERYKNTVKRLAQEKPEDCKIIALNRDGSILASIPIKWVKIAPPKEISEKQKEALSAAREKYFSRLDLQA